MTTFYEIADEINGWFREYGLTHDVVEVVIVGPTTDTVYGAIRLDPRENEPDVTKWRATERALATYELRFVDGFDLDVMENLRFTFMELFRGYAEAHPPNGQLRLF